MKYKVLSIVKSSKITQQGDILPTYEISFQLENEIKDSIEILEESFSKEYVKTMIEEKVEIFSEIMELE